MMRINKLFLIFIPATLALVLFLTVSMAQAQESKPFYWEFINVEIDLQENGDMLVSETQKYVFTGSYSNERHRWLPLGRLSSIEDVEVFEGDKKLFISWGIENNQVWIHWQHQLTPPESHTFVIKYRVKGGLQVKDGWGFIYLWLSIF